MTLTPRQALDACRARCPLCRRYGIGYAHSETHIGHRDYTQARCRYCGATWRVGRVLVELVDESMPAAAEKRRA